MEENKEIIIKIKKGRNKTDFDFVDFFAGVVVVGDVVFEEKGLLLALLATSLCTLFLFFRCSFNSGDNFLGWWFTRLSENIG